MENRVEFRTTNLRKIIIDWENIAHSIPNLRFLGHPDLRKKCKEIKRLDKNALKDIAKLKKTFKRYQKITGKGVGMAAPQIGITKRFIIISIDDKSTIIINPRITTRSKKKTIAEEWCMSMGITTATVIRPKFIAVEYLDEKGIKQVLKPNALNSRLLQHEIDHLDGILCIDRAIKNGQRFVYDMKQFRGIKDVK